MIHSFGVSKTGVDLIWRTIVSSQGVKLKIISFHTNNIFYLKQHEECKQKRCELYSFISVFLDSQIQNSINLDSNSKFKFKRQQNS